MVPLIKQNFFLLELHTLAHTPKEKTIHQLFFFLSFFVLEAVENIYDLTTQINCTQVFVNLSNAFLYIYNLCQTLQDEGA